MPTDFSLITGPGNHAQYLIKALQSEFDFDYTEYWPNYGYFRLATDKVSRKSRFFDLASYLTYGIRNKLRFITTSKWHQDILFPLYDLINSKNIEGRNLIAWPQTSLRAMQKVKALGGQIILEQPMIHVDAWNAIAAQQYLKLGIHNDMKFSAAMVSRMKQEYNLADRIVVHSSFAKKTFTDNGVNENKVTICPLGLDIHQHDFNRSDSTDLNVLFVGRVEILKGIHILQDAVKLLDKHVKVHVVGYIHENARSIVAQQIANIKYYGQLSKASLLKMYEKADVLVFPSLYDGFGMVLLEAMSLGIPVIASKNSAGPDIIRNFETGFIVEPSNASQIAERLDWMRQNKEAVHAMGETARQLVERDYSLVSYRSRVLQIVNNEFGN